MDVTGLEFVRGVELADKRFVVAAQDPAFSQAATPHTGYSYWSAQNGWDEIGVKGRVTVDLTTNEDATMILSTDQAGIIYETDGTTGLNTGLGGSETDPLDQEIRCVQRIGDHIFAAGVARQVYMRQSGGSWHKISTTDMMQPDKPMAFQGICGNEPNAVYAAGFGGELWRWNGKIWRQIASPTNIVFNAIASGPNACVAVGMAGQVAIGIGDAWDMVEHDATNEPFWSVQAYHDAFYLTALSGIYRLKDGHLEAFRDVDDTMRTVYGLSTGPSGLWSVGSSDIALFDGETWQTIAQS